MHSGAHAIVAAGAVLFVDSSVAQTNPSVAPKTVAAPQGGSDVETLQAQRSALPVSLSVVKRF